MIESLFFDKSIYNKELIVRKKVLSFIEKFLKFEHIFLSHNRFKKVCYSEDFVDDEQEILVKKYYDSFVYLISNYKNNISENILNKFIYLITDNIPEKMIVSQIVNYCFSIDNEHGVVKASDIFIFLYKKRYIKNDIDNLFVALCLFNFYLIREGIPLIPFSSFDLTQLIQTVESEHNIFSSQNVYKLLFDIVIKSKRQPKSYYKKLIPLNFDDIYNQFKQDEEELRNDYGVLKLGIYGSFGKDTQRIDSDIDVLIKISRDISYEKRSQIFSILKNKYYKTFKRYIDLVDIQDNISNLIIIESRFIRRIINE